MIGVEQPGPALTEFEEGINFDEDDPDFDRFVPGGFVIKGESICLFLFCLFKFCLSKIPKRLRGAIGFPAKFPSQAAVTIR